MNAAPLKDQQHFLRLKSMGVKHVYVCVYVYVRGVTVRANGL